MAPRRRAAQRGRGLKRTVSTQELRPQVVIFCEGKTEQRYLEHLAAGLRRSNAVVVEIAGQQGVPSTLARKAKERARELKKAAKRRKDSYEARFEV